MEAVTKKIILLLPILLCGQKESYYQKLHCKHKIEYRLSDKSRVDCLEPNYATEYDFAHKWAECVGQTLFYSISTQKKPKCVIILKSKKDQRFIKRIKLVSNRYNIKIQIIKGY